MLLRLKNPNTIVFIPTVVYNPKKSIANKKLIFFSEKIKKHFF